jgi:hypothetical protein
MTPILETQRVKLCEFSRDDLDELAPMVADEDQIRFYPRQRRRAKRGVELLNGPINREWEYVMPASPIPMPRIAVELPRVVAAAAVGATVVAVVDRRPPLAISNDAGRTWREAGGGLPAGFAVAIDQDNPDVMLYAGRNRVYLSENGGIFWRALVPELPEIEAVTFL